MSFESPNLRPEDVEPYTEDELMKEKAEARKEEERVAAERGETRPESPAEKKAGEWVNAANRNEQFLEKGKIKLPEDPARKEQLKNKLAEYRDRMSKPQYQKEEVLKDLKYREAILSIVLDAGQADHDSIRNGLMAMSEEAGSPGKFDDKIFDQAFKLIKDYAETGGKDVKGGTGLK